LFWHFEEAAMKAHFERMARYNRWANRRLYGAVGQLDRGEFHAARSGFFPSLAKTLNHLVVTDRIWLGRFTGQLSAHRSLDEAPYDDFAALTTAREVEDQRIIDFFAALPQSRIDAVFDYRNMAGEAKSAPMLPVLAHLFNHQAHHRGQAHGMLSATAVPPPALDLVLFLTDDQP
jgi:uncharacterized damage-inducible protein DinB